ncbi:MAG: elongation factor P [Alphaproteobacteria bacterium]|jgi:elongation factor P|nr:elongation factor P [Alphaproteobacteria bacterium]MCB1550447.1 elongation factor P [Alphaproteobacteria bacterium]MCB9985538.1 elongation factor P [Micavibrio sp.]HPQ50250.1 elongation factor P [Alphaproteobacteria bacterium]
MKTAQELKPGNVVVIDSTPIVIQKAELNKSGRNAAVMKFKFRNLLTGGNSEAVYKTDEKFEDIILETKQVSYSYEAGDMYVFMDEEYNQYELSKDDIEGVLKYLEEQMPCEVTFYEGKPISVTAPVKLVREVVYTEPAVRGDTSGKVMKPARLPSGYEILVPAFVEIGEKIEIDTRTDEYVSRVK